jgi:hypothetical protein
MSADTAESFAAPRVGALLHPSDLVAKPGQRSLLTGLVLGMALLWPAPLGGALLMVVASFGLAISWETGPGPTA